MRRITIVMGSAGLEYAQLCLRSMAMRTVEPLKVLIITDDEVSKQTIAAACEPIVWGKSTFQIVGKAEADERAHSVFSRFSALLDFREGHPCWRKLTDPVLFCPDGEELIILDPDVYFPNVFAFESTPEHALLLMWQPPNCLFPPDVVRAAFDAGVRLAHHVDIGVAHLRPPLDYEWMNWFVSKLGGRRIPRRAHVEAVCWAALAIRMSGGYLNPRYWVCWRRTTVERLRLRLGWSPYAHLVAHQLEHSKCFHAGGGAKLLLMSAFEKGLLDFGLDRTSPTRNHPFVELTRFAYESQQVVKTLLRHVGRKR